MWNLSSRPPRPKSNPRVLVFAIHQTSSSFCNSSKTKPSQPHEDPNPRVLVLQLIKNHTKIQPHEDLNPQRRLFPKEEEESNRTPRRPTVVSISAPAYQIGFVDLGTGVSLVLLNKTKCLSGTADRPTQRTQKTNLETNQTKKQTFGAKIVKPKPLWCQDRQTQCLELLVLRFCCQELLGCHIFFVDLLQGRLKFHGTRLYHTQVLRAKSNFLDLRCQFPK